MGAPLEIMRTDHTSAELRALSNRCADGAQVRRILAMAMVLDGRSRTEAAELNGMDRQTLRDWVHRYNACGIAGLKSRRHPGRAPLLTPLQRAELLDLVIAGPDPTATAWFAGDAWTFRQKSSGDFRSKFMRTRSADGCTSLD